MALAELFSRSACISICANEPGPSTILDGNSPTSRQETMLRLTATYHYHQRAGIQTHTLPIFVAPSRSASKWGELRGFVSSSACTIIVKCHSESCLLTVGNGTCVRCARVLDIEYPFSRPGSKYHWNAQSVGHIKNRQCYMEHYQRLSIYLLHFLSNDNI